MGAKRKFDDDQIREIRACTLTRKQTATLYGTTCRTIDNIKAGLDSPQNIILERGGDPEQVLECVLVRSDNEAVVVNITDVDPVEPPESVYWVDPIHAAPKP